MEAKPGRHVDDVGEAHRVALGEPESGEALQLLPDLVGGGADDPVARHPCVQVLTKPAHRLLRALVGHRLTEPISLPPVEAGADPGQLHELLLEDGDAQGLLQDLLGRGVGVDDRLLAVAPAQIGMDRLPLDRPGADQRDLYRQVVEGLRLHLGQGRHLGPGLDLEQPHGVGAGDRAIDGLFLWDDGEVDVDAVGVLDQVVGEMEGVEHPQPEQVELDDPHCRRVVLVPLEDGAALESPPLQGDHLPQGPIGDHHSPGVDPEMAGEAVQSPADVVDHLGGHPLGQRAVETDLGRVPGVHVLGEPVYLGLGEPEGLGHVTEHRLVPDR